MMNICYLDEECATLCFVLTWIVLLQFPFASYLCSESLRSLLELWTASISE